MNMLTLFNGTKNQTTYNLLEDLTLLDIDELENDLLVTVDLGGITLEYISTHKGLELDAAYIVDGGYCYLPIQEFMHETLKNRVETLVMESIKWKI